MSPIFEEVFRLLPALTDKQILMVIEWCEETIKLRDAERLYLDAYISRS